ncbi:MAG: HDIG domain-containing protein [Bdellovibrionaceae bacterium]|jgi:cyclic-di-AMP phosphodiesterase PgpH|nr:HDIG domain-containing protein [Pseudobdellovibrionaceae bacterium]
MISLNFADICYDEQKQLGAQLSQNSKKNQTSKKIRSKYISHTQKVLDFVDTLGLEKTFLGRFAYLLDSKFNIRRVSLLFLFCFVLSFVIYFNFDLSLSVKVGGVATADIKSPINFVMLDEIATEEKRIEAEKNVPLVFDYDPDTYEKVLSNLYSSFHEMRMLSKNINWPKKDWKREEKVKEFLINKEKFEEILNVKISKRIFEWLVEKQFSVSLENIIKNSLISWFNNKIIDKPENLFLKKDSNVLLRNIQSNNVTVSVPLEELKAIKDKSSFKIIENYRLKRFSLRDRKNMKIFANSLVIPNVTFNRNETESKKSASRESVLPVQISIKKNQVIVNNGSVITPLHVTIFNEVEKRKSERNVLFVSLLTGLLLSLILLVFHSYLNRVGSKEFKIGEKTLSVMTLVTFMTVLMTKLFIFITDAAFLDKYGSIIPSTFFLYAAPVVSGSMIIGMLVNSGNMVWLYTCFLSLVMATMMGMDLSYFVIVLVGGIAAARGAFKCEKRNDIYWAGLGAGGVSAVVILLIVSLKFYGKPELGDQLLWNVPAGLIAGVLASMITMMVIPLIESAYSYTTDIKLLELSNLSHPLMQELIVKAPGTYHHSLVVGSMVEAAAKEIGANSLLGKVMAYYHDVGKSEHPHYFIENQRPGYNPHDHVSPYMSKTILVAHVKDGAEKALEYKLGKAILDGILQHHGTTLISYFYNRALEEANGEPVDENEFRYPGPKPQFKEAALVMLADSIEAAARSFDEPTAARLQKLVKDIIQAKFLDGQLEECNLTLRDLSIIENAFEHVLLGMYHQRIDYPGQKQKEVDMAKKEVKKGKAELRLQENVSTKKSS